MASSLASPNDGLFVCACIPTIVGQKEQEMEGEGEEARKEARSKKKQEKTKQMPS